MPETEVATDTEKRGVSELVSVITLLGFVLAIVLALGLSVLFLEPQSSGPSASFSFSYTDETSFLLISHDGGDELEAGKLLIRGPDAEARWSEINTEMDDTTLVGPGDAIRIGPQNAYGSAVRESDRIEVVHVGAANETTVLGEWSGSGI